MLIIKVQPGSGFLKLDSHGLSTHNSLTNQPYLRLWNNLIECEKLERDLASEGHSNAARREPDTSAENAQAEVTM